MREFGMHMFRRIFEQVLRISEVVAPFEIPRGGGIALFISKRGVRGRNVN